MESERMGAYREPMEKGQGSEVLARRGFLRGEFGSRRAPMRPPWAIAEAAFVDTCTRCDRCIASCPTRLLVRGSGGFPQADFGRAECNFCGECVSVCRDGALRRESDNRPWALAVTISQACFAYGRVVCRSCGDVCEVRAIRFRPCLGGAAKPEIDPSACTGCGACIRVCPTGAVGIAQAAEARQA
jgi:ferredoxin-type protein NapF